MIKATKMWLGVALTEGEAGFMFQDLHATSRRCLSAHVELITLTVFDRLPCFLSLSIGMNGVFANDIAKARLIDGLSLR